MRLKNIRKSAKSLWDKNKMLIFAMSIRNERPREPLVELANIMSNPNVQREHFKN
jgi:hypothetical protein